MTDSTTASRQLSLILLLSCHCGHVSSIATESIGVINVFYVFYSGHVLRVLTFLKKNFPRFLLKKSCQMQSINM